MIQLSVEDFGALIECLEAAEQNAKDIAAEFGERYAEEEAREANRLRNLLESAIVE